MDRSPEKKFLKANILRYLGNHDREFWFAATDYLLGHVTWLRLTKKGNFESYTYEN